MLKCCIISIMTFTLFGNTSCSNTNVNVKANVKLATCSCDSAIHCLLFLKYSGFKRTDTRYKPQHAELL